MTNPVRTHVIMSVIILVLALALLTLVFVPPPPVMFQQVPAGGDLFLP